MLSFVVRSPLHPILIRRPLNSSLQVPAHLSGRELPCAVYFPESPQVGHPLQGPHGPPATLAIPSAVMRAISLDVSIATEKAPRPSSVRTMQIEEI
jgi:hypothetical protein